MVCFSNYNSEYIPDFMYHRIIEALECWSHFLALVLIFLTRTETELSRISRLCYLGCHSRGHWWLMRSPYYLACCDMQSCLESQICTTSSPVFYPEVGRFFTEEWSKARRRKVETQSSLKRMAFLSCLKILYIFLLNFEVIEEGFQMTKCFLPKEIILVKNCLCYIVLGVWEK